MRGGGLRVIQRSCKACFGERDRDHDAYDEKKWNRDRKREMKWKSQARVRVQQKGHKEYTQHNLQKHRHRGIAAIRKKIASNAIVGLVGLSLPSTVYGRSISV